MQADAEQLMQWHCSWAVDQKDWPPHCALWLYGLAARINKPPAAATSALFRSLLQSCQSRMPSDIDCYDTRIPEIGLIMAVAGAYFGQHEGLVGLCRDEFD